MNARPHRLLVPGLGNSGPEHWQTLWEREPGFTRAELGCWMEPAREAWINRLGAAIDGVADREIGLVAHSLGCLAVAWWAATAPAASIARICGALLVAPPDVERKNADPALTCFRPAPRAALPFTTLVVASSNDPYASLDYQRRLARSWGARFVDVGPLGHINAESGLGAWPEGRRILDIALTPYRTEEASRPGC